MARSALLFAMIIGLAAAATENAEAGELVNLEAGASSQDGKSGQEDHRFQVKMVNQDTGSVQMIKLDKIEYTKEKGKTDAMSQMTAIKEEVSAVEKKVEQFQKSHKKVLEDRGYVGEVATLEKKLDQIAQTAADLAPRLDPAKIPTPAPTTPAPTAAPTPAPTPAPTVAPFDHSDILTSQDQMDRLTQLINENSNELDNAKWKRCWTYSFSDQEGDNWQRFWGQCGGDAPDWQNSVGRNCGEDNCKTITILKTQDEKIIGGYGSKTWMRHVRSVDAPNSFLFTLGDNAGADTAIPSQHSGVRQMSASSPRQGGPNFGYLRGVNLNVGYQGSSRYFCNQGSSDYQLAGGGFCPSTGVFGFSAAEVFMLYYP